MDMFARPVSLTFNGKKRFTTLVGGCFTIVLLCGFIMYAVMEFCSQLMDPVLMNHSMTTFFSQSTNTYAYNITTTDSTLAVCLAGSGSAEVDSNLRVVFMQVV